MNGEVTFIHTADLHLGRAFAGLASTSSELGTELLEALSNSFRRVIDLAIERRVDFVVMAGDTFDSADISYSTHREFIEAMKRLDKAGIRVYLNTGNHDPMLGWSRRVDLLPPNVSVFPTAEVGRFSHVRDGIEVAVLYGRGFNESVEMENFALGYRRAPSDPIAIGVLHSDTSGDASYAPCTPGDLIAGGLDYWALGHIHKTQVVLTAPPAIYPGSPQGLNINENSDHGCYVVSIEPGAPARYTFVKTGQVAWERYEVDIADTGSLDMLEARIAEAGRALVTKHGTPVCARVVLTGRGDVHAEVTRAGVLGELADAVNACYTSPGEWLRIDAIDDRTSALLDESMMREAGMFPGVVLGTVDELATRDDLLTEIDAEARRLFGTGIDPSADPTAMLEHAKVRVLDALMGGR